MQLNRPIIEFFLSFHIWVSKHSSTCGLTFSSKACPIHYLSDWLVISTSVCSVYFTIYALILSFFAFQLFSLLISSSTPCGSLFLWNFLPSIVFVGFFYSFHFSPLHVVQPHGERLPSVFVCTMDFFYQFLAGDFSNFRAITTSFIYATVQIYLLQEIAPICYNLSGSGRGLKRSERTTNAAQCCKNSKRRSSFLFSWTKHEKKKFMQAFP